MIGIISAFGASFAWTYACFIWRKNSFILEPVHINLLKNLIAFIVFIPAIFTINFTQDVKYLIILLFSGVLGIGLGDTFYIKSLKSIGTRRTLSIEGISPILAAFSGQIFIQETLSVRSWIGIIIVSCALFKIIKENKNIDPRISEKNIIKNFLNSYSYSFLSVLCAVSAASLSRIVLLKTNLSPFQTTEIRLLGAIIYLLSLNKFKIDLFLFQMKYRERFRLLLSIILGTNIGIFLQQIVFKTLPLGIGWTLLSSSPIVSLLFTKKEEGKVTFEIITVTLILSFGIGLTIL